MWYVKRGWPGKCMDENYRGKTICGWNPNAVMPNDRDHTDPVGGEYAFSDTPCRVSKA
jgi:hypothetical protein